MAVSKIERYLIGNQCSAFLTGVMCEYLVVLATEVCTDPEQRPLNKELSNQDDFQPVHWQPLGQLLVSDVLEVA